METSQTDLALWRHERRRTTLVIVVLVVSMLALLFWFLLHRSSAESPARRIKNVVFGRQVAEAAEQFARGAASGNQRGQGQQAGQGGAQAGHQGAQPGRGGDQTGAAGAQGGDLATGGTGADRAGGQTGSGSHNQEGRGPGQGGQNNSPLGDSINPQHPANNPPDSPAPPPRSIGWLDRFFGTQRPEDPAIRAGEGGTGENLPGSGNTNIASRSTTNVAVEFTGINPPAPATTSLEEPPPPARSTNRAPAASNALNDNFEQLLQQHHAGSGDVRISLMWNNKNDIDLHVVEPGGEEIYYQHRASRSGGVLDIDMNAGPPLRNPAVENVFWPQRAAPPGTYRIYVNHYSRHDVQDLTPFTVRVLVKGRTTDVTGTIRFGEAKKLVHQFTLAAPTR
jgi:hypothetical protein